MKEILKEFVDSIGFMASALIVLLIFPIGFVNLFGMLTNPAGAIVIIVFCFLMIPLIMYNKPCQKSGAVLSPKDVPDHKRSKYLPVELAEMKQEQKQEHILRLPLQYDMFAIYQWGHPREYLKNGFSKNKDGVSETRILELLRSNICNQFSKNVNSELTFLFRVGVEPHGFYAPANLLAEAVENLMRQKRCDRKYIEKHFSQEMEFIRWQATYCCLEAIFGGHGSVAKVYLEDDISGYTLTYPFGLSPISHNFDSSEEQEQEFISTAIDRLEECKAIARSMKRSEREKVFESLGATKMLTGMFMQPIEGRNSC